MIVDGRVIGFGHEGERMLFEPIGSLKAFRTAEYASMRSWRGTMAIIDHGQVDAILANELFQQQWN
jgi:hypothetical protein